MSSLNCLRRTVNALFLFTAFVSVHMSSISARAQTPPIVQALNEPTDAKIKITEYADFQCPHCARARKSVNQLIADYGDRVQVIFKNFPLAFHDQAMSAAIAGLCAHEQNQFKSMHDFLFDNQSTLSHATYLAGAQKLALDIQRFEKCLVSPMSAQLIDGDLINGKLLKVSGTPTFFFTDGTETKRLDGNYPYAEIKAVVDELLNKKH